MTTFVLMVSRVLISAINKVGKKYPVISVTGPRQSGKSTLIKNMFPKYKYVSLEDIDVRQFAETDPRGFLTEYKSPCIIDEAQRVPALFNYLQGIVDQNNKTAQYVLSGSQNFLLMEAITQSLAGRVALFKLLPFSYQEISDHKNKPKSTEEAIFKGFYPRIYDKKIDPAFFYESYVETYIERDIRLLKNIGDLKKFTLFLKLCAGRCGQVLNIQSLANDTGITQPTAKAWLSLLETSYILFFLQPYTANVNKRLVKTPKLYFYDTGLVCYLLSITQRQQITTHYMRGNLFENMVVGELYKERYNKGISPNFYFWRDSNQNEIDLVWESGSTLNKLEIKYSDTVNEGHFKTMNKLENDNTLPKGKKYLIMNNIESSKWYGSQVYGWRNFSFD